jgi:hypothetical protein
MRILIALTVSNEAGEELLLLEVGVVRLEVLLRRRRQFHSDELEALALEAGDDFANESSLNACGMKDKCGWMTPMSGLSFLKEKRPSFQLPTVRLDHNESAVHFEGEADDCREETKRIPENRYWVSAVGEKSGSRLSGACGPALRVADLTLRPGPDFPQL